MKHHRCRVLLLAMLAVFASAALAAENRQTVKGRVRDVNAPDHQLTVTTDEAKDLTFRVDERSKLERNGRPVALDNFKKGMRVEVAFESSGEEKRIISMTPAIVSSEEVRKEIREALQAAKSYTFEQKDEYHKRLNRVLERTNERIDQLRAKAAQSDAKKEYSEQIEKLRRLRAKLQAQAERVKSATPGAWKDLKAGLSSALQDLGKAFEKAGDHFR